MTTLLGLAILVALILYALTGGADYGGGFWDLLAFGRTREKQRARIARTLGPIWEANHVWLILVVTIVFTAFPAAFAAVCNRLHIPIALLCLGVVLRGAAFTFRAYDKRDLGQRRWGGIFSAASLGAPLVLGDMVGCFAGGGRPGWFGWIAPWPIAVGLFTLALFAWLSATYLCVEADRDHDRELTDAFQGRAMLAGFTAWILGAIVAAGAFAGSPALAHRLFAWPALPVVAAGVIAGILAVGWVAKRRWSRARWAAIAAVALVLAGWGAAQFPYLMLPDLSLFDTAAPPRTQALLLAALGVGSALLFPSIGYLYRVFFPAAD